VFIPLHDKNPRILIARPWVTWGVILSCAAVFAVQSSLDPRAQWHLVFGLGLIPATLVGNMLFLWVFGDNIEDAMGHRRFAAFFLAGGAILIVPLRHNSIPLLGVSKLPGGLRLRKA